MTNDDAGSTPPTEDLIRYDRRTQEALLGVIRDILTEVSKKGLPGEHHFYVTFNTQAGGVDISEDLHKQYPEDMTIVIQRQFWDLTTSHKSFEIGLTFSGKPEKLTIPYHAITRFIDPSVNFALQFEEVDDEAIDEELQSETLLSNTPQSEASNLDKTTQESSKSNAETASADIVTLDSFRKKT